MRAAIVSDVHGSLAALRAVAADLKRISPDIVLHGGDLAVNGPHPNEVIDLVREQGWHGVVGNTDEMLWRLADLPRQLERMQKLENLLRTMYEHTAPAALERISDDNLDWVRSLPRRLDIGDITLLHASPDDLWRAPPPHADDHQLATTYEQLSGRVVVYGHIHRPFVRSTGGVTFANSGSVGLTWDGDPRASYLLLDDSGVMLRRVEYDVDRDVAALTSSKMPYAEWLVAMRRTGRFIPPLPDHE